ncbi:Xaa-Pro peptidase family protein [Alphaproteobacteria bacterium]|nr:Xaa-Pro peptidase family protein [Alphaproteobacteria bacterium]
MQRNFQTALNEAELHKEIPFPKGEFESRLLRIREAMAAQNMDLLFLTSPEAIYYVSGFQGEWYQAQSGRAFTPSSGIAVHVNSYKTIHFETPSEAVLTAIGAVSEDVRIFPLESRRDGLPFILSELKSEGWLSGKVGLERYSSRQNPTIAEAYKSGFENTGCAVADCSDLMASIKHIKSPLEMAAMRKAAAITHIGMTAAKDAIQPGISELEVFGVMIAAMAKAGGEISGLTPPVTSGFRSNCLHALASRKTIAKGERVVVDLSGVFKRYHVNMARTFWVGEPPEDVAKLHNTSVKAYDIIAELIRPNLLVSELLEAVNEHYASNGLLEDSYWSGGYELGIAFPPDWVGSFIYDASISKPGDCFKPSTVVNHECNFFGPRATGMSATIDTLFFHEKSAEIATTFPRTLEGLCL